MSSASRRALPTTYYLLPTTYSLLHDPKPNPNPNPRRARRTARSAAAPRCRLRRCEAARCSSRRRRSCGWAGPQSRRCCGTVARARSPTPCGGAFVGSVGRPTRRRRSLWLLTRGASCATLARSSPLRTGWRTVTFLDVRITWHMFLVRLLLCTAAPPLHEEAEEAAMWDAVKS